ncbi:hypothetical protein QCN29_20385 [Streptomyces sp. HNM0663]|uniref:Uncharacterized protein n=1 Tax=Streptomyces chengmaiensis TaxID=3040919 RepID=A0ABT6HQV5_9ACTN|nr:hypothetical protein [Streptomyces chengmaiensis]MDH2391106.1 hypothetical protein [Streptomyces chengmaiensis]
MLVLGDRRTAAIAEAGVPARPLFPVTTERRTPKGTLIQTGAGPGRPEATASEYRQSRRG